MKLAIRTDAEFRVGRTPGSGDIPHHCLIWDGSDAADGVHEVLRGLDELAGHPDGANLICAKILQVAPDLMILIGDLAAVYTLGAKSDDFSDAEIRNLASWAGSHQVETVRSQAISALLGEIDARTWEATDLPLLSELRAVDRLRASAEDAAVDVLERVAAQRELVPTEDALLHFLRREGVPMVRARAGALLVRISTNPVEIDAYPDQIATHDGIADHVERFAKCPENIVCTPHGCEAGGGNWPRCPK